MDKRPNRPRLVGEPLDPRFLQFIPELEQPSVEDWHRRLKQVNGLGSAVPIGDIDPSRDLLLLVPGKGMDFRDTQALSELQDTYQVVILISDHDRPWDHGGRNIALALEQFMDFRHKLAVAQGFPPNKVLRLIGHSAGTLTAQAMLADFVDRGVLSEREDSLFSRVRYWAIDGPWRGADLPWIVQLLMLKLLRHLVTLPPVRLDEGAQSAINRLGPLMNTVTRDLGLPRSVLATHHIYATGMQDLGPSLRHYEPVSSFLWEELGEGEGQDIYEFLRKHKTLEAMKANRNDLDSFSPSKLTRRRGLQNLALIMIRDYPELIGDLQKLAEDSSVEEFGTGFNPTVRRYIHTYEGQHTEFMWTNPQFMKDIREELKEV